MEDPMALERKIPERCPTYREPKRQGDGQTDRKLERVRKRDIVKKRKGTSSQVVDNNERKRTGLEQKHRRKRREKELKTNQGH